MELLLKSQENDYLSSLIERGKKVISSRKVNNWTNLVRNWSVSLFSTENLEAILEIMEAIAEQRNIDEIVKLFNSKDFNDSEKQLVRSYVLSYSKYPFEFYKKTHKGKWTSYEESYSQFISVINYNSYLSEDNIYSK